MKIAFVFPGQGAQKVGMGKELYEKYGVYQEIYQKASEILGRDIAKLTFESEEEQLCQTENTQIAILTMSLAILALLKQKEIKAEYAAGLSLGEYAALVYGGILSFEDAISMIQKRGHFMQTLVPQGNWSMAAIIGLEDEKVEDICHIVSKQGFVVPANYNCPGQVAISGEKSAVQAAMEEAKKQGAKRAIELKTSGPFHTEKLKQASEALKKELDTIEIHSVQKIKIMKNIDGTPYKQGEDIREILANHVISPVKFSQSIQKMIQDGVDTFIEIGPGKVLSGFIKKINKEVYVLNICDEESLKKALETLSV